MSMFTAQCTLSCYESSKQESKRDRNMFQAQKPWAATRLPEVPSKLWHNTVIHQFMSSQDSGLMQMSLDKKNGVSCQENKY
jgi:hypothetical protein